MDTRELQRQISTEAWDRYRIQCGTGATSSAALTKLQRVFDAYKRKYPDGTPKVASEVGPEQRKAAPVVAALKSAALGGIAEASAFRDGYLGVVSLPGGA